MHRHFNTSSSSSQWLFHQLFFLNWGQHVCVFWAYAALSILSKLSAVHQRPRLLFSIWECNKTHFIISNRKSGHRYLVCHFHSKLGHNFDQIYFSNSIPIAFHTLSRMGDNISCQLLALQQTRQWLSVGQCPDHEAAQHPAASPPAEKRLRDYIAYLHLNKKLNCLILGSVLIFNMVVNIYLNNWKHSAGLIWHRNVHKC